MPFRFAFLLIVVCSVRAVYAQETTEHVPEPLSSPVCSHVPDPETDSDAYNSGFKDGYKTGCKHALATQRTTSQGELDEARPDLPAPTSSPSLKEENDNLLRLLGEVCKGADVGARKKGVGQTDAWNLKYRIALLTRLIEHPPSDCQ